MAVVPATDGGFAEGPALVEAALPAESRRQADAARPVLLLRLP
jgi:hypothetical protein